VTKAYKLKIFVSERKVLILKRLHSKESASESSGWEMTILLFKSEITLHPTGTQISPQSKEKTVTLK
jgi:hypothetical protein